MLESWYINFFSKIIFFFFTIKNYTFRSLFSFFSWNYPQIRLIASTNSSGQKKFTVCSCFPPSIQCFCFWLEAFGIHDSFSKSMSLFFLKTLFTELRKNWKKLSSSHNFMALYVRKYASKNYSVSCSNLD